MVGTASALVFTLDSYDVTLNDNDPGLALYWSPILSTPASADLEVGDSITFALFELGTYETWSNPDDEEEQIISVEFDFSSPEANATVTGETVVPRWGHTVHDRGDRPWRALCNSEPQIATIDPALMDVRL